MHLDEVPLSPEMLHTRSLMRSVEVDGIKLRIATTEGESGQVPLVMFNGIGANLELLEPFVDELDPRIPTLRFDAPGIGGSPTRYFPYRFAGLARTVDKLCDQLGYKEVDVFGISWGGAMAQEFVRRSRHRCRRLILAATSAGAFMIPAHPRVLIRMASPLRYIKPSYMEKISPIIYGGDFRNNPELATEFTRLMRAAGPVGYFQQMFAGLGWTSIHWLPFLKQPVLIMAGTDDPIIPLLNAKIMAKLIPKSKLVTYDCGHLFLFTRMEKAAREMEGFLLGAKPF
ncbi:MAG: poly(3-hydroxyalkanoate) depolymerase [Verrucomicrobia bacterium]|nr:poly(3-hydroxyalkanoate) depolymerase [Verrucomicrobiota bacterium]